MAKSKYSENHARLIIIAGLLVAFIAGFVVARVKYKPQILELNKMVTEKDQALTRLKADSNKVMMKDDTMWVVENGIVQEMKESVQFTNGDEVDVKGKVMKKDGTESVMMNGDAIDMEGNALGGGAY